MHEEGEVNELEIMLFANQLYYIQRHGIIWYPPVVKILLDRAIWDFGENSLLKLYKKKCGADPLPLVGSGSATTVFKDISWWYYFVANVVTISNSFTGITPSSARLTDSYYFCIRVVYALLQPRVPIPEIEEITFEKIRTASSFRLVQSKN